MEKCLRLYESFYTKFVKTRVLDKTGKSVDEMFDNVEIQGARKRSFDEKNKNLEILLHSRLSPLDLSTFGESSIADPDNLDFSKFKSDCQGFIARDEWDEPLKIACNLLVELSTFPSFLLPGDCADNDETGKEIANMELPEWLKVGSSSIITFVFVIANLVFNKLY